MKMSNRLLKLSSFFHAAVQACTPLIAMATPCHQGYIRWRESELVNVQACRQKTEKWGRGGIQSMLGWTDEGKKGGRREGAAGAVTAGIGTEEQRWGDDEMVE